jgi:hypothetical protein
LKFFSPEYNISLAPTAPMFGRTHSDESRKKMSDAHNKIENYGGLKQGKIIQIMEKVLRAGKPSQ